MEDCETRRFFPSFEEGWQRRSSKMPRYLNIGAVGEVKPMLQEGSDLPRCALFKVARHFVYRAQRPLLEGGKTPGSDSFTSSLAGRAAQRFNDKSNVSPQWFVEAFIIRCA
jgi:hypothetical protein